MKILLSSFSRCWWQEPRSCPGGDTFSPEDRGRSLPSLTRYTCLVLKKRPENDRIYHEEIKILQHCYATTANSHNKSQPFVIVTWRNNEIGILDFGPHGVYYLSSTVSILLLSYFSLTKRRVNFTSFHWRSWTTDNKNNGGFNIFMWYYILSVKCQSICIWEL